MVTVRDIYDAIDVFAPYGTQLPWDNSGLMTGSFDRETDSVLLALDCTADVVKQAKVQTIPLIVCHHPLIFHAVKHIDAGSALYEAVRNDITVLSAHTNLDMADGGVNDVLCGILGLTDTQPLYAEGAPIMRMGNADFSSAKEFSLFVSQKLGSAVRLFDIGKRPRKIAVCGGAGGEYIPEAAKAGCDTFVTGEAKHHEFLLAAEWNINLLVAGHFATENPVMAELQKQLQQKFPELSFTLARQNAPYETVR